jgi:asparagine synthetase B (glutamine-hydrolysing)
MHPKTTTMDLNISTALWFAAGGRGTLLDDGRPYHSTCRILLLGMGADEQMGGYGRHRNCVQQQHGGGGYSRLRQELDLDLGRLWERNLGRDDRLVSDHGKEARFLYLDAHVVTFLSSLELQHVCDFNQEPGIGDKQILRLVAQRLGLTTASGLVKRAIQFGSRIAHVSDKRRFGSQRKATGESHFKASADTHRDV